MIRAAIKVKNNRWALMMVVILLSIDAVLTAQSAPTHSYTVDVFDVGTGLSVLVRGPSWNVLFDGGSNDESNKFNRLPDLMAAAGLASDSHLDYVILSHPHTDHDLLLDDILDNYSVGEIWDSGAVNQVCSYFNFIKAVEREQQATNAVYRTAIHTKGSSHMPVFKGHSCFGPSKTDTPKLKFGERLIGAETSHGNPTQVKFDDGAKMTLLYGTDPHAADFRDNDKSYNDFSFVVSLLLGGKTVLLMGDAQGGPRATPRDHPDVDHTIEKKLLDCCMDLIQADFMVVGHHGSETSSRNEFLDAVDGRDTRDVDGLAPVVANSQTMHYVISAGPHKYSSVQLPDEVVVEDLRGRFSQPDKHVWRTDLHDLACDDKNNNVLSSCPSEVFTPCINRDPSNGDKIGHPRSGRYGGCDNVRAVINGSEMVVSYWPR